ncbi:MAG: hypothetical protein D6751_01530 [Deltaproteobacteria bacterium]|nr:MAG: hypothetical protein D6751_01530 [Deltaproteobacteria bacterium]
MWEQLLEPGETIVWQARPQPRCYTFRHWRLAVFGLLLTLLAAWWEVLGWQMALVYDLFWLAVIPVPAWLLGLWLSIGRTLMARREWPSVAYAVTEKRILACRRGRHLALELDRVGYFCLEPQGEKLGSVRVESSDGQVRFKVCCIEYPRRLTDLLEAAMKKSGVLCGQGTIDTGSA